MYIYVQDSFSALWMFSHAKWIAMLPEMKAPSIHPASSLKNHVKSVGPPQRSLSPEGCCHPCKWVASISSVSRLDRFYVSVLGGCNYLISS